MIMWIHGKVVRLLRPRDEATGYSVFLYLPEEQQINSCNSRSEIICFGKVPMIAPGMPLELEVEEKKNTFKVISSKICTFRKAYSLYFLKDIKGISSVTANRILEGLDNDIGKLLEMENPVGYLETLPGSKRYIVALMERMEYLKNTQEAFISLSSLGLEFTQIDRLVDIYKNNLLKKIRTDTYAVCSRIGIDFLRCDYLAKYFGKKRMDVDRIQSIGWELLLRNENKGNTRISVSGYIQNFYKLLESSPWPWYISPVYLFCVIQKISSIRIKDGWISLKTRHRQEEEIAKNIFRIYSSPYHARINANEQEIQNLEEKLGITFLPSQKELYHVMSRESLILLTGGPGTGKTTIIRGAINIFQSSFPDAKIGLCAPTARAAQIAKEKSGFPASTIHRLAEIHLYLSEKEEPQMLDYDMIIVDEMSMVDTFTFYRLLKVVKTGCLLILCGDPDQLESVGCGAVFRDLLQCGYFPVVQLNDVIRQEAGSTIMKNYRKIKYGDSDLEQDSSFQILHFDSAEAAAACLKQLFKKEDGWMKQQILSTTNKGPLGTEALNRLLGESDKKQECLCYRGYEYKVGDKVVFTVNNYKEGYCNGDIGIISGVTDEGIVVSLDGVNICLILKQMDDILPGFVLTIHKAQGAESEELIILLPDQPASLLSRHSLFTAVSRARKKVTIIEIGKAIETAISNRKMVHRVTALPELLKLQKDLSLYR